MRLTACFSPFVLLLCSATVWCGSGCKPKSPSDRVAAKTVADSFMSDLVANRTGAALDRMEPELSRPPGRTEMEKALPGLFDYCGRPLDSEFKHYETAFKLYMNGRRKPMQKFYYAAKTDQHPKGVCFFAVEVVPGDTGGFQVTSFGPLKAPTGEQVPDFLR